MSLYRYLKSQGASWYVPELVIKQTATTSVSRILVIEKQANLIRTQMLRLNSALAFEAKQESSMSSEVRANLELLNRLLESHRKAQQEAGIEPKPVSAALPSAELSSVPPRWDFSSLSLEQIKELRRLLALVRSRPPVIEGEAIQLTSLAVRRKKEG